MIASFFSLLLFFFGRGGCFDFLRFYCIIYLTCADTNTEIKSFALHTHKAVDYDEKVFIVLTSSRVEAPR